MKQKSILNILSSIGTSLLVGALVGLFVYLGLVTFFWGLKFTVQNHLTWVYFPAIGVAVLMWLYILLLFLKDEYSPEEMWEHIKNYFSDLTD
jgi:phosphate/sulfate permease